MSDRFRRLSGRFPSGAERLALVVGMLTIVGAVALAVGVYIALEPENGTPANGAAVATDGATTGGGDATKAPTASAPSPTVPHHADTYADGDRDEVLCVQGDGSWGRC